MSSTLTGLLSLDALARAHGGGAMNPALRAAVEKETRFRQRSAGPDAVLDEDALLPEGVVRLPANERLATKAG
ncbi:MAG: hypothetical protein MK180_16780 [Rhodobacteraceae bacterium]|nr:hypothetical protein [Paracoccaceae bacterium]